MTNLMEIKGMLEATVAKLKAMGIYSVESLVKAKNFVEQATAHGIKNAAEIHENAKERLASPPLMLRKVVFEHIAPRKVSHRGRTYRLIGIDRIAGRIKAELLLHDEYLPVKDKGLQAELFTTFKIA